VGEPVAEALVGLRLADAAIAAGARHPKLTAAAVREFRRAAFLESATASAVGLLESRGVACVVLKGAPLARRYWPAGAVRDMGDVDILVDPSSYAHARGVLLGAGFKRCDETAPGWYARRWFYHESFVAADRPVLVELHWDFMRPGLAERQVPALLADAIRVPCGPYELPGPDDPWQMLVVAAHVLHEMFGLRQLLDVAFVARALDDEGWTRAVEVATRARLTSALYYALALSAERLGTALPPAVGSMRPGRLQDTLVRRYTQAVPPLARHGTAVYQLHHVMAPLLHCRGSRCLTRLPHAMLTDRANVAVDLQRLSDRVHERLR
jgi:hypothetical protein